MNTYCLIGEIWVRRNGSRVLKQGADSVPALGRELLDVANPAAGKTGPVDDVRSLQKKGAPVWKLQAI
jgi:hypothetical protein